ncbi:hypothetical protein Metli_1310 [Methanofollis liminatans DSM 4140]|uniref:DUF4435 domain-containing protein n=1 Tax=Methanofollis liminatans DSM 4140 TaxID=28892 RepID=J1L3G8_9EURY|nr:DUF4435 domain-containing protein [Methanofollis liminatans]EJG07265.1 hypothetical protein Metli_1310 [Methanofollis liminatans DSM 4140]
MREHITPKRICNKVRMFDAAKKSRWSYLLLEGDSDTILFNKIVEENSCEIIVAHGKSKIIESINELNGDQHYRSRVVGIVDKDFDPLVDNPKYDKNIILLDTHDIETLVITSPSFYSFVEKYVDREKLAQFERKTGMGLLETLLRSAYLIGTVRCYNERKRWALNFKDLVFSPFTDKKSLVLDFSGLLEIIEAVTDQDEDVLEYKLETIRERKDRFIEICDKFTCPSIMCNGHDIVKILKIGLDEIFGSEESKKLRKGNSIERAIIEMYDPKLFCDTNVYRSVREWEKNTEQQIFKDPISST